MPGVAVKPLTPDEASLALRRATVQLVVEPGSRRPTGSIPPGPRAGSRDGSSMMHCSGPQDAPMPSCLGRRGRPLRRALRGLAGAGTARHHHHERQPLGHRVLDRPRPVAQSAEAAERDTHAHVATTCSAMLSRGSAFSCSKPACCLARADSCSASPCTGRCGWWRWSACWARSSFAGLALLVASRVPDDRGALGADEPDHAADVDCVGRVLLVGQLSRRAAAGHPCVAADCAE